MYASLTSPLSSLLALTWPQRGLIWLLWASFLGPLALWSVRTKRPGAARLLAAAPIVASNLTVPLLFSRMEVLSAFMSAVATSFLTNLKIAAWIMDRGSLIRPLTLPQFMAVVSLPVVPTESLAESSTNDDTQTRGGAPTAAGSTSTDTTAGEGQPPADAQAKARRKGRVNEQESGSALFVRFVAKAVGLAVVVHILNTYSLPAIPKVIVQTNTVYLFLSIGCDLLAALVTTALRMPVAPHFENFYLSSSINDFWSRRWNQIVSNLLRNLVYDPIMEGHLVRRPGEFAAFSRTRRLLGLLASFTMSGLLHECLFWYATHRFSPHLLWFWHFLIWGVIIVAENVGKKAFRKAGLTMPPLLAWALTQIIVHSMVALAWFPPLNAPGTTLPRGLSIMEQGALNIAETYHGMAKAVLGRWVD